MGTKNIFSREITTNKKSNDIPTKTRQALLHSFRMANNRATPRKNKHVEKNTIFGLEIRVVRKSLQSPKIIVGPKAIIKIVVGSEKTIKSE
jgi:hypothetical protein